MFAKLTEKMLIKYNREGEMDRDRERRDNLTRFNLNEHTLLSMKTS